MGDYNQNKNISNTTIVKNITNNNSNSSQNIDTEKLIKSIVNAIKLKINNEDDFDNTKTLEKMAESMVVNRNKTESNFENLGGIEKNKKDVSATVDLLKNLGD